VKEEQEKSLALERTVALLKKRSSYLHFRLKTLRTCFPNLDSVVACDSKLERLLGKDSISNCYLSGIPESHVFSELSKSPKPMEMVVSARDTLPLQKHPLLVEKLENDSLNGLPPPSLPSPSHHLSLTSPPPSHLSAHTSPSNEGDQTGEREKENPEGKRGWTNFFPLSHRKSHATHLKEITA
jgi:hypothetical protein